MPVSPAITSSREPRISVATTGFAISIASMMVRGMPSRYEGSVKISIAASRSGMSLLRPVSTRCSPSLALADLMRSSIPGAWSLGRRSPIAKKYTGKPCATTVSAASRNSENPFSATMRPIIPIATASWGMPSAERIAERVVTRSGSNEATSTPLPMASTRSAGRKSFDTAVRASSSL